MVVGISSNSAEHGELHQGWSQEESASPHVVGDSSGATRQTTFTAQASATSDLLIGKQIGIDGPFDSLGNVLDVTLVGDQVSTSSYDVDSAFLPVRDFPAVASGFEEAALDLVQRMYGAGGVTLPWTGTGYAHAYYPLRGFSQGFTVDGQNRPYFQGDWGDSVTGASADHSFYHGADAVIPTLFVRIPQGVYCRSARPLINPTVVGDKVNYMAFRVRLGAAADQITTKLNWQYSGSALSADCFLRITRTTGTAGTIGIDGNYRQDNAGSLSTITTSTVPTTGLDMSKEIGFVIQWGYLTTAATGATLRIKIYAYDPDSPPGGAPSVVLQRDLTNAMRTRFVGNNTLISRTAGAGTDYFGFRDVIVSQSGNTWPVHYPVIPEPALIGHSFTKTFLGVGSVSPVMSMRLPVPAWSGSGWDYLKMLAAARGLQHRVESGVLMFRDLFPVGTVVPVTGTVAPPTLRVSAAGRARSVDVIAHGSSSTTNQFDPPNFVEDASVTVRLNEESTFSISLPEGVYYHGRAAVTLTDNDDVPVSQADLWDRGGRFTPDISIDGLLTFTVRGPKDAVGLGEGPWRVESVRVTNVGFLNAPDTITLYTGTPDPMVTRDKGGNVDNPFLNSTADVFDRSTWLISSEGSPQVSLSFEVPDSVRSRYEVGQVVSYGFAQFRVMSVRPSRGTTQVDAVWFTTQAQQTAQWGGQTANQWNTFWAGRRAYDVYLRPLASPAPANNPAPFVRVYPSQSKWSE